MVIKKITHGFVIQKFDTEKKKFVSQEFVAGDCDYEDDKGNAVDSDALDDAKGNEYYLSYDMVQPK